MITGIITEMVRVDSNYLKKKNQRENNRIRISWHDHVKNFSQCFDQMKLINGIIIVSSCGFPSAWVQGNKLLLQRRKYRSTEKKKTKRRKYRF